MLHLHKYVSCSEHEVFSKVQSGENMPNQGLGMSLSFEPGMYGIRDMGLSISKILLL